ncbi:MAG: hypothetical protein Q8P41_17040 [Pseudomonadota bacterium]|nr:hypothetical protein [Pseudomonadota bacterium]
MTALVALVAEVAGWLLGAPNRTESFAWFRVQAHLGLAGLAAALIVGLAFAAWRIRRVPPAWPGALLLHGLFLDVPQAQPDVVTWFTLAQHVARAPFATLLGWPALVWTGEESRFHKPFPGVPTVYGAAFRLLGESTFVMDLVLTAWAVALPLAVTWAARGIGPRGPRTERTARLAGWLVVGLPLLQAQSGWLLADLPLCACVAVAWGALLRVRGRRGLATAALACLPAVVTKVSGAAFVLGPALALALPLPAFLGVVGVGTAVAFGLRPPRVHAAPFYFATTLGLALHLRTAAWIVALPTLLRRDRLGRLVLGAVVTLPQLVAWSPIEHAPRYALPVALALSIATARASPAVARFLVGSGLVLLIGGYRPILRHNQALNLQEATRTLVAQGVDAIEVRADAPGTTFPPAALAALVDLYAPVPVRTGAALALAPADKKRHWWEFVVPPPWRAPGAADGLLLCLYAADATRFEAENPGWTKVGTVSRYRSSSVLLPREVVLYTRAR